MTTEKYLSVCIDSNVIVSAIAFGGKPLEILDRALSRQFHLVLGPNIIAETKTNLVEKIGLSEEEVARFINDLLEIASIYVPEGKKKYVPHPKDSLVLEVALVAGCDILVTGDKKHLLPLEKCENLIIESPAQFLKRITALRKK